jgi:hypothetical protein
VGWIRDNWWESISADRLKIANSNIGTPGFAGIAGTANVYNGMDFSGTGTSKIDNVLMVHKADIGGDLPAPVTFNITNNMADGYFITKAYIASVAGNFVSGTAAYKTDLGYYRYEGEASTLGGTISGTASAPGCSGTAYIQGTISTAAETSLFNWTLPQTAMSNCLRGDVFNLMARFANTNTLGSVKFRWKLFSGTTAVWNGPQFQLSTPSDYVQYMGAANIPPSPKAIWTGTISLTLTGQRIPASGTCYINLDYIQLFGRNFVKAQGLVGAAYFENIYLDSREQYIYRSVGGGVNYNDWMYQGNDGIYLDPRYNNLLFFMFQHSNGTSEITRQTTINAYYHPRRRTL